jgi:hypothetical protein
MKLATKRFVLTATVLALTVGTARADLIALYQFNNPNDLGEDTSGHGNNATDFGATFSASGYQGGAAKFNSNSLQYLSAPVNISPASYPELTIGAWVNTTALNPITGYSLGTIASSDDGDFDRTINVDTRGSGGKPAYSAFVGGGVVSQGLNPIGAGWTFVAAVYDGANGKATYYSGNNSGTTVTTNFDSNSYSFFDIGKNPGFGEYFTGYIDNLFVYNEALTPGQINTIRANGFVPEPSSIVLGGTAVLFGIAVASRRRNQANA